MGKDSPSPPPAPDYRAAAQEQGVANEAAARLSGRLSNPNIYGPYGSQTVEWGKPTFNQAGYDKALADYNAAPGTSSFNQAGYDAAVAAASAPRAVTRENFDPAAYLKINTDVAASGMYGSNPLQHYNDWGYRENRMQAGSGAPVDRNAYTTYTGNPTPTREQFTINANADQPTVTQTLTPAAQATLNAQQRVQRSLAGLGEQGIGNAQRILGTPFSFGGPAIQTSLAAPGPIQTGVNPAGYEAQGRLNTSGIAAMPVNAGTTAQQAIMSRLDPSIARNRVSTETQLINQGLRPGGEAYNNAINLLGQQENDQRTQAALQGINLDFAANQQGFGQATQQNAIANQASAQNLQNLQNYQQQQNAAQGMQFNQGLAGAQFGNTAQQNALAQALQLRGMPLNEITALMSGSQIQNPQFQAYQGQSVAPPPLAQAAAQQAQFGQNIYNQQVGQENANTTGLFSLGGAGLGAYGTYAGLAAF